MGSTWVSNPIARSTFRRLAPNRFQLISLLTRPSVAASVRPPDKLEFIIVGAPYERTGLTSANRVHFPAGCKIARHLLECFGFKLEQRTALVTRINRPLHQSSLNQMVYMA